MCPIIYGSYMKAIINIIHVLQWNVITILYEEEYSSLGKFTTLVDLHC